MGLAERQRFLARLVTDEALRVRFGSDPIGEALVQGLDLDDSRMLASFPVESMDCFGQSLWIKRRSEVEPLLPLTIRAMGASRWRRVFQLHLERFQPSGVHKPFDDAMGFARWLGDILEPGSRPDSDSPPYWVADLCRFEAAFLACRRRRLVIQRFRHRVDTISQVLARGQALEAEHLRPTRWPVWVAWVRWSRRRPPRVHVIPSSSLP